MVDADCVTAADWLATAEDRGEPAWTTLYDHTRERKVESFGGGGMTMSVIERSSFARPDIGRMGRRWRVTSVNVVEFARWPDGMVRQLP